MGGGTLSGPEEETLDANSSSWNTALEASLGFASGEASAWATRAGISFEYGDQTFGGEGRGSYTGFTVELGTGVKVNRLRGAITYYRGLTREFSDWDPPPGRGCLCPDGLRLGLGVVF